MSKRKLDLSQTLAPLETEYYNLIKELKGDAYLFNTSIDAFIQKYSKIQYHSIDDLLAHSTSSSYLATSTTLSACDKQLKELLP